jgi:hypothetical protein
MLPVGVAKRHMNRMRDNRIGDTGGRTLIDKVCASFSCYSPINLHLKKEQIEEWNLSNNV